MGTQEDQKRVDTESTVEVTEQQVNEAIATRRPPKVYEIEIQADGSAKVVTDLNPQDMKFLLEFGLVQLMGFGYTVQSLVSFFPTQDEQDKKLLNSLEPDQMAKA